MTICDFCGAKDNVYPAVVEVNANPAREKEWELDLCPECADQVVGTIHVLLDRMVACGPGNVRIASPGIPGDVPGKT